MSKKSKIFERITKVAEHYGLDGIPELAKRLGYSSAEKLYRLDRSESAKPSFEIVSDFARAFKSLNIRWFITGEGEIQMENTNSFANAAEPSVEYGNKYDVIFKLVAEGMMEAMAPVLKSYDKKIQDVHDRISLKEEMEALRAEIKSGQTKAKG